MSQNESQNTITLADLIENVKLGGGSVLTSITQLEPPAGPPPTAASPPAFPPPSSPSPWCVTTR